MQQAKFDLNGDNISIAPPQPLPPAPAAGNKTAATSPDPYLELELGLSENELAALALLPERWQERLLELARTVGSGASSTQEHTLKAGSIAETEVGRGLERLAELALDAVGLRLVTEEGETRRALAKLVFNKLGLALLTKEDAKEIASRLTELRSQFAASAPTASFAATTSPKPTGSTGEDTSKASVWQAMGIEAKSSLSRTETEPRMGVYTSTDMDAPQSEESGSGTSPTLTANDEANLRQNQSQHQPAPIPANYFSLVATLQAHSAFIFEKTGRRTISPQGRWLGISVNEFEQFVGLLTDGQRPEEVAAALGVAKLTDLARERYHLRNDVPVNLLLSAALHVVAHYVQPQFSKHHKSRSGSGANANDGWW
jgi:hypothetical protein